MSTWSNSSDAHKESFVQSNLDQVFQMAVAGKLASNLRIMDAWWATIKPLTDGMDYASFMVVNDWINGRIKGCESKYNKLFTDFGTYVTGTTPVTIPGTTPGTTPGTAVIPPVATGLSTPLIVGLVFGIGILGYGLYKYYSKK